MQFTCQLKKCNFNKVPAVLCLIWLPLLIVRPRYATFVFASLAIWSLAQMIHMARTQMSPSDIRNLPERLKRIFKSPNALEWGLNAGLLLIGLLDYWRPYTAQSIELRMMALTIGAIAWWHAVPLFCEAMQLRRQLLIGCVLAMVALLVEHLLGHPLLQHVGKSVASRYAIVAMTFSVVFWVIMRDQSRVVKIGLLMGISGGILYLLDCDTAAVGLWMGAFGYLIGAIGRKVFWRIVQVKIVVVTMALPFLFHHYMTTDVIKNMNQSWPVFSHIHRLHVWTETSHLIMERPWIGYGLQASQKKEVGQVPNTLDFYEESGTTSTYTQPRIPNHPHNMILQWWLEWGAVGALWWALVVVAVVERMRLLEAPRRQMACAYLMSNLAIILFSINFWQTWWWATWLGFLPLVLQRGQRG